MKRTKSALILAGTLIFGLAAAVSQTAQSALPPGSAPLMNPEELVKLLQGKGPKPLILNLGSSTLFMQARIPGAEYVGPGSNPQTLASLRNRVKTVSHDTQILIYCGCCPWEHCPNVAPAYEELHKLGFRRVKVLYLPTNLGADWVYKGYPTIRGQ